MFPKTFRILAALLFLFQAAALWASDMEIRAVEPGDGSVTMASSVTLSGEVEGATGLWIDGAKVSIDAGGRFSAGPFALAEGDRLFVLTVESGDGRRLERLHRVVRDSQAPRLIVSQPVKGAALRSRWVVVEGRALDPRLASVHVDGRPAEVKGGVFTAVLELGDGSHAVEIVARDELGQRSSEVVGFSVDTQAPVILLTDRATGRPVADGAVFPGPVSLELAVNEEASSAASLDGQPWSPGSRISSEGWHTLAISATDRAGHVSRQRVRFRIDRRPPSFGGSSSDGMVQSGASHELRGRVSGASSVSVDGRPAELSEDGEYSLPVDLEEGRRTFQVEATDAAGNVAQTSLTVTKDASAPVVTVTSPVGGAVFAASPISVSGSAVDQDALAEVRLGGQVATLTGEDFHFAAVPLVAGVQTLSVEAEDAVGNVAVAQVSVTLDTEAPVIGVQVDGVPLVNGAVFAGSVTPQITVDDLTSTTVEATLDGLEYVSGTTVDSAGQHELSIDAMDAAGRSASLLLTFSTHQAPPVFEQVLPAEGTLTGTATVSLSGRVSGAATLTVDGQAVDLVGDGDFISGALPLSEGENVFTLLATSTGGQSAQLLRRVVLDATAPSLTVGQPADGALLAAAAVDVGGSVEDAHAVSVTVNGVAAARSGSSFLAQDVPLVEGENTVVVVAEDAAGNTHQVERTVTVDTEDPEITITDPAAGTVVPDAALTLRGTAADSTLDRVEVAGRRAQLLDGVWSIQVDLDEGPNTLTAIAFDRLGHSAEVSVWVSRDVEAPAIQITEPADGLETTAASVEVRGTVAEESGLTVTVNGLAATVDGGTFVVAEVPLPDGESSLIARATDAQGNTGLHTRTVHRDNTAPEMVSEDPIRGALALAPGTDFELTFSEPLADPPASAWRLETAAGVAILAIASLDGETLRVTPEADLPSETDLRLVLTAGLTDPAGNALANPQTLDYRTADIGAPDAPVLDAAPPSRLCAASITLEGVAEADSRVSVSGGAAHAEATAGEDGRFSLSVPLLPEGLNALSLRAVDGGGNASPETTAEVVHDCTAPEVVLAVRSGELFIVTFDEAIDLASLAGAVRVSAAGSPVAGDVSLEGGTLTFTPAAALPSGALLLEVDATVTDLAGNALAFPYSRLFDESLGDSFFSGTVIDDATGRPLSGVRVVVTATDGVAPDPQPELTTAEDGRFVLAVVPGTHDVTFARVGYTPVFRLVTTSGGQGTEVFDPRLTPAAAPVTIGTAGGSAAGSGGLAVTVPASAFSVPRQLAPSLVGEQGLAAMLPFGWSPRGGAWLAIDEDPSAPLTLSLPVSSPDGTVLTFASLELGTLQWRAVEQVTVSGGAVSAEIPGQGAYAALEPDAGGTAPPPAVAGEILGSTAPPPVGDEISSASLAFDPELVLPSQSSLVTVSYDEISEVASGLPLTLVIQEELELLDGEIRRGAPYRADLVLYRAPGGEPRSVFTLEPSEAARDLPVRLGAERVIVQTYGEESVRGNVLGPAGGTVVNDEGDRLSVPAGALPEPTAVVLRRRAEADVPLPAPARSMIEGVIELDMAGELLAPGLFTLAMDPAPAAGEQGLLLQVIELDGESFYRVVAELEPVTSGWASRPIDPADLPWPGVRGPGLFVFVRLTEPHGFARGGVTGVDGAALSGALVGADGVGWIQLSAVGGGYALPLPVGPATVRATHRTNGNGVAVGVTVAAEDERLDLPLVLQVSSPYVVEVSPAHGATGIPLGVEPTVRFSEAVDPSSLAAGVRLLRGGEPVTVTVAAQGSLVTVSPAASLEPETAYEIQVGVDVLDLQGYSLASPQSVIFTTAAVELPGELNRRLIRVLAPDAGGLATVQGLPGAVPAETLVFVENLTSFSTTESVTSGQDGSFEIRIGAALPDRLLLHVLIVGANEAIMVLPPFLSPDLKAAYVHDEAARFETGEGIEVEVEEGTFSVPTWVRVEAAAEEDAPAPTPEALEYVTGFLVDFGEATAQKPIRLRLPAPAGTEDGTFLLNRFVDVVGRRAYMMHDILRLEGGFLTSFEEAQPAASVSSPSPSAAQAASTTFEPPAKVRVLSREEMASLQAASQGGVVKMAQLPQSASSVPSAPSAPRRSAAPQKADEPELEPRDYTVGLVTSGYYQVVRRDGSLGYLVLPIIGDVEIAAFVEVFGGITPVAAVLDFHMLQFMPRGAILPTLLGQDFELTVIDLTTGYQLFRELRPAPTEPLLELPPDLYGDTQPPVLLSGSPLRFFHIQTTDTLSRELEPLVTVEITGADLGQGTLRVTGDSGAMKKEAKLRLLGLDDGQLIKATAEENGSFQIEHQITLGHRFLLALGGQLTTQDAIILSFNEALPEDVQGIKAKNLETSPVKEVDLELTPIGTRATLAVKPRNGWPSGTFSLEITTGLKDGFGNAWPADIDIPFTVEGISVGDPFELGAVQDVARLGSLLFVAGLEDGLSVLDASDPKNIKNFLPGELAYPFPMNDAVRGVAVDPHGRVLVVGGGSASFGQMKILDPQLIDPAEIDPTSPDLGTASDPRFADYRGSTLLSDPVSGAETQLPNGIPRRVAVMSNDVSFEFTLDLGKAPAGLKFTPNTPPEDQDEYVLRVELEGAELEGRPGNPVSLRHLDRGAWHRTDADEDKKYTFDLLVRVAPGPPTGNLSGDLVVREGDRFEILRNLDAFAYVSIDSVGVAVVDVNDFYDEDRDDPLVASQVLRYYQGYPVPNGTVCDPAVPTIVTTPTDLAVLLDRENEHPLVIPTLIRRFGLGLMQASLSEPADLAALSHRCAEINDDVVMGGMAVFQSYPMDLDGDGKIRPEDILDENGEIKVVDGVPQIKEIRDYIVVSNSYVEDDQGGATGWLMVYDVTDRDEIKDVGRVKLPGPASALSADPKGRRLFVGAFGDGVYVVDFGRPPSLEVLDADRNGKDDRVLDVIDISGESVTRFLMVPELGLAYAGGQQVGLSPMTLGPPPVKVIPAEGAPRALSRVAPFGVPTAPESEQDGAPELPGLVRVQIQLPGGLALDDEVELELISVGPGGLEIDGAGDPERLEKLPPTSYRAEEALVLRRQASRVYEEGYNLFVSEPVVLLADLKASAYYQLEEREKEGADGETICPRCDLVEEKLYTREQVDDPDRHDELYRELLTGHGLAVRFPESLRSLAAEVYGSLVLDRGEIEIKSVPWDIRPSVLQEPTLFPSTGSGDVAPGTLLHSGEMTHTASDLRLRGRGFDFVFTRTYRNQIVGGGPLGPGWDHGYRMRLRELPSGDVELFDARGRVELFKVKVRSQGTYASPKGLFMALNRKSTGWLLLDARANLYRFDAFGRLVSLSDPNKVDGEVESGTAIQFRYDPRSRLVAAWAHDRQIFLEYDGAGRLEKVRDFTDREWTYGYDEDGRLVTVETPAVKTYPDPDAPPVTEGLITRYAYEEAAPPGCQAPDPCFDEALNRRNNLVSVTDPRGQTWLELVYEDTEDEGERAEEVTQQTWGGHELTIAYLWATQKTHVTDRRGKLWRHDHNEHGQPTKVEDPIGRSTFWEYYDDGNLKQVQLPSARQIHYVYDSANPAQHKRGNSRGTTVTPHFSLIPSEGQENHSSSIDYVDTDRRPRPERIVDPRDVATSITLTETGLPKIVQIGEIRVERQFNRYGELSLLKNGEQRETRYEYFEPEGDEPEPLQGLLKKVIVDPDGHAITTEYGYDSRGNQTVVTNPRGVKHRFVFNELDWLIEERWAKETGTGQVEPIDYFVRYRYDQAGNVVEIQRAFGESGGGFTRRRATYGLLSEPLDSRTEITPGQGDWTITTQAHDANFNVIQTNGPDGQVIQLEYDDANQVVKQIRKHPDGDLEEHYAYDHLGQLKLFTDAREKVWETRYDGYDRPREWVDPIGNVRAVEYDAAGNPVLSKTCDAGLTLLAKTVTELDDLARPVKTKEFLWSPDAEAPEPPADDDRCADREPPSSPAPPQELDWITGYDKASNVISVTDPLGQVTHFRFDDADRLVETRDELGNKTTLTLDHAGNPVIQKLTEQSPDGEITVQTTASFDAFDRQTSVTDALGNTLQYSFDRRGNLVRAVDAESRFSSYQYDGLDRLIRSTRPEDLEVRYTYDKSSRLIAHRDARDKVRLSSYDVLDRLQSVTHADSTWEGYEYDENGNLLTLRQANGNVQTLTYDDANRLTGRSIALADGVVGPAAESFSYDGLHRLTQAVSGSVSTQRTYDSLSRQLSDLTDTRATGATYNAAGSLIAQSYPSGLEVRSVTDVINRPRTLGWGDGENLEAKVQYGYRGVDLVAQKTIGSGISGELGYDAVRRLSEQRFTGAEERLVFGERMAWSDRDLLRAQARDDLNERGLHFTYDKAGRLASGIRAAGLDDATPVGTLFGAVPASFGFTYDTAENLLGMTSELVCEERSVDLPLDGSGRNRPGSIDETALIWDEEGNLIRKGDVTFAYDYRNRLTEVHSAGSLVASYTYDTLNRRIRREVGGAVIDTVWFGWQPVEEYVDGKLRSRRTFGIQLDEIVSLEQDLDGDGELDQEYLPFYDQIGNLVMLTNVEGKPIERYEYSPYGERWVYVDSTPPAIEQVRVKGSEIWIELSEEVSMEELDRARLRGELSFHNVTAGEELAIEVERPVLTGRQRGRRLVIRSVDPPEEVSAWPEAGEDVQLVIRKTALVDFFHNTAAADLTESFAWPAADEVVEDQTPPRLEQLCVIAGGHLEIQFSEEISIATAGPGILVDGAQLTWSPTEDGYGLRSAESLEVGSHSLSVETTVADLAGLMVAQSYAETFEVAESSPRRLVYSAPFPNLVASSTVGNAFGFHGLPADGETGLLYVRNRYFDPELGRFITTDPFGFADGPSPYQFALNDPVNLSDPTGELVPFAALAGMAISGGASVALGAGIEWALAAATKTKYDYTGADIAMDFIVGAGTFGLGTYFTAGRHGLKGAKLFGIHRGLETGLDVAASAGKAVLNKEELDSWELAKGAALNFAVGEAATFAVKRLFVSAKFSRPGRENRSPEKFYAQGQLTDDEVAQLSEIAREHRIKIVLSGSLSETDLGFRRRGDVWVRQHFPEFRRKKWRAALLSGGEIDVDMWEKATPSIKVQKKIARVFGLKRADLDFGYRTKYYPELDSFAERSGALVFDGTRRNKFRFYRIPAPWQKETWP